MWLTHTCDEHNPTGWTGPDQPNKRVGSWLRTLCRSSTAGRRSRGPAVPCVADARRDMHDEMRRTQGLELGGEGTPPADATAAACAGAVDFVALAAAEMRGLRGHLNAGRRRVCPALHRLEQVNNPYLAHYGKRGFNCALCRQDRPGGVDTAGWHCCTLGAESDGCSREGRGAVMLLSLLSLYFYRYQSLCAFIVSFSTYDRHT